MQLATCFLRTNHQSKDTRFCIQDCLYFLIGDSPTLVGIFYVFEKTNEQVNVNGLWNPSICHMNVLASLACASFSVSRVHVSVFLKMFEEKILASRNGKSSPSPRTNCKPRTRCSSGLWSGKPSPSGCSKCSNYNLREPTPAPSVASPPFQLLNYLISGGSANLRDPFCHSSPYLWSCTGFHSESPPLLFGASFCESNPNSSLYSESR